MLSAGEAAQGLVQAGAGRRGCCEGGHQHYRRLPGTVLLSGTLACLWFALCDGCILNHISTIRTMSRGAHHVANHGVCAAI